MVVRPTKDNLHRLSYSLPFRARMLSTFMSHLFPEQFKVTTQDDVIGKCSKTRAKVDENIMHMMTVIGQSSMLEITTENRGLKNFLSNQPANPEQSHDLLSFRTMGQEHLLAYIDTCILHKATAEAPRNRLHRIKTFATSTRDKLRSKQIQREEQLVQACTNRNG